MRVLFTAPTAFRAIKREDPAGDHVGRHDLSAFRTLFLAGERTDPDTLNWAREKLRVPVIDHWWQTETGWSICANCVGIEPLPVKEGSPTRGVPGMDVRVVDETAQEVERGTIGALVVKLPLPPGTFPTLWNAEERYVESYLAEFPGYYKTADAGYMDEDDYVYVMSRTDDIINVAGHRLSTGAMEEVLAAHPDVAECAVAGVDDALKGQGPPSGSWFSTRAASEAPRTSCRSPSPSSASASARSPRSRPPSSSSACPRPAPARSCAAPCRRSRTARSGGCPPPSTTPRSSTRSRTPLGSIGYPAGGGG